MAEFKTLKEQFEQASARWPNLQSLLVRWPEDQAQPNVPAMRGLVELPAPEGELHLVAAGCGTRMDTENGRYRSGFAGMLVLRREFGKLGTMDWWALTDEDVQAVERFNVLADQAAELLGGQGYGLSADTMQWKARTRWRLAVHELTNRDWEPLPRYSEDYEVQTLKDVFLDSAFAMGAICEHDDNGDDGPLEGNQFRFSGTVHDMPPVPWKLLNAMWGRERRDVHTVEDEVWDIPGDNELRNGLSQLKGFLEGLGFPKYVSKARRSDFLVWKEIPR